MGGFGAPEILIIVAILVLLFGAKKIPELAKGIGQGMNEFKKATNKEIDNNNNNENSNHSDSADAKKTQSQ